MNFFVISLLFLLVEHTVENRNSYPTPHVGLLQLWEHVEETYKTITIEQCERLYASMPYRIAVVWLLVESGQDFDHSLYNASKNESMYIVNFGTMYFF
jgi:hypothetical protein